MGKKLNSLIVRPRSFNKLKEASATMAGLLLYHPAWKKLLDE
jgi:hypothetical protein